MAMHYHRHGNALPSRWSCITITMVMHYHRDGEAPPPLASVETLAPAIMSQTEQTARSNAMAEPLATNGVRTCCWKSAASNHSKTLTMFWMRAGAHETVLSGQRGLALCCLGASPPLHRDPHHDVGRRSTVFQACLVHGAVSSSAKLGVNELAATVRLELRMSRRLNHGASPGVEAVGWPYARETHDI